MATSQDQSGEQTGSKSIHPIDQIICELQSKQPLTNERVDRARESLQTLLTSADADGASESLVNLERAVDEAQGRYAAAIRHAPLFYRWSESSWRSELASAKTELGNCVKLLVELAASTQTKLRPASELMVSMRAAGIVVDAHPVFAHAERWFAADRLQRCHAAAGRAELQINELLAIVPCLPGEWSKPAGQLLLLALGVLSGSMARIAAVHGLSGMSLMTEADLLRVIASGPMLLGALLIVPATLILGALNRHLVAFGVARLKQTILTGTRWFARLAAIGVHGTSWIALGTILLGLGGGWIGAAPISVANICVGSQSYSGQMSVLATMVVITEKRTANDQTSHWLNRSRFQGATLSPTTCIPPVDKRPASAPIVKIDALRADIQAVAVAIAAIKPTVIVAPSSNQQEIELVLRQLTSQVNTHRDAYLRSEAVNARNEEAAMKAMGEIQRELSEITNALNAIDKNLAMAAVQINQATVPIIEKTNDIALQIHDLRDRNLFKRLAEVLAGRRERRDRD